MVDASVISCIPEVGEPGESRSGLDRPPAGLDEIPMDGTLDGCMFHEA